MTHNYKVGDRVIYIKPLYRRDGRLLSFNECTPEIQELLKPYLAVVGKDATITELCDEPNFGEEYDTNEQIIIKFDIPQPSLSSAFAVYPEEIILAFQEEKFTKYINEGEIHGI